MKLKIVIAFLPFFLTYNYYSQTVNPTCGQGSFSKIGGCIASYSSNGNGTALDWTQNYPSNADGLAMAPAFGFSAPDPTYWTVVSGVYYYYNGTSFVSSGHSAGGSSFVNPGGSTDYIYNINQQGQVSVYDGTSNASVLTSLSSFSGSLVQDIVGDQNNNFYLVKYGSPSALLIYDHTGALTCTYSLSTLSTQGAGLAITNNKLFISYSSGGYQMFELSGSTISYISGGLLNCNSATDLASCPSETGLFAAINSSHPALTCTLTSLILNSNDQTGNNNYSWSGPGISGSVNSASLQVSAPGNYTRTAVNCGGLQQTVIHKVKFDSILPALSYYQASKIKCAQDVPVMLSANGFSAYTWVPAMSLTSSTSSIVYANPSITTNYSVTGFINGCSKTAIITVSASPIPIPVIASVSDTICKGNSISLNVSPFLSYVWLPGNFTGNNVVVSPPANVEYTVTGTDDLGCKTSSVKYISVVDISLMSSLASKQMICENESVTLTNSGADKYITMPGNYSGSGVLLKPLSTTIFTVTGTSWQCTKSNTLEIKVNSLPVIHATVENNNACIGQAVIITASGAQNYKWDGNAGSQTAILYPSVNTTYNITGIDPNGCSGELFVNVQVNECTALTERSGAANLNVYPNPVQSTMYVDNVSGEDCHLEVFDLQGRVMMRESLEKGSNRLNMQKMEAGLYIVRVSSKNIVKYSARITVE